MIDINQYLEETNTVLLTKESFEYLKERANALDKIRVKILRYRDTIDRAIAEDSSKIEGMKEAYDDCLEIIDKYLNESENKYGR